jgi:plasmid stabilization system protein ParE
MGKIVFSRPSLLKLGEIRRYYAKHDLKTADRAIDTIEVALEKLVLNPEIGRPFEGSFSRRLLIIPFGKTGFISLYEIDKLADRITIVALRHQREKEFAAPVDQ